MIAPDERSKFATYETLKEDVPTKDSHTLVKSRVLKDKNTVYPTSHVRKEYSTISTIQKGSQLYDSRDDSFSCENIAPNGQRTHNKSIDENTPDYRNTESWLAINNIYS